MLSRKAVALLTLAAFYVLVGGLWGLSIWGLSQVFVKPVALWAALLSGLAAAHGLRMMVRR